jgi:hypothetical protein
MSLSARLAGGDTEFAPYIGRLEAHAVTTRPFSSSVVLMVNRHDGFLRKQESMLDSLHTPLDSCLRGNDMSSCANS